MSATSFSDKLKDLNLTSDEIQRFSDAFKNEEFRKLFLDYAEELNDPKNRELYESEIRAAEQQRGSDVTFVHPKPGHVLKTTINGKTKCFINIATNENVDKPSYTKTNETNGKHGVHWSLPHCLAGPHDDVDNSSNSCTVYDVIFSPDTYRMAETNVRFMKMLEESALDSIEKNYNCQLDKNNVKRTKLKFKGVPKATIIRKKRENQPEDNDSNNNNTEDALKSETDEIIDNAFSAAQNHKVVLSSHNRIVNSPSTKNTNSIQPNEPRTDENGFTIPIYKIVHRGEFDMQDCTNSLVPQVRSTRPKELIVEIELPLCSTTNNVDLDVCEYSLKLHCDSPKYSLDLALPYPVRESDSHARFDKKQRKLIVTLAVIKETPILIQSEENLDMEDTNEDSNEITPPTTDETEMSNNTPLITNYSSIPFEYKQGLAHFALVLYVKNVDKTSFKIENDGQHITIQLTSLGSGCFPLNHQLCLDFNEPMTLDNAENSTIITYNDDNMLILFKKTSNSKQLDQFSSGTTREDMKINYATINLPNEKPSSLSKQTLTKEDFLLTQTDSSTSDKSDQTKKLTRKEAKKLAKENRKNQTTTNVNDKLVNEISKITLESENNDEISVSIDDEKNNENGIEDDDDDNIPNMIDIPLPPSVYRRHMSESQVYHEPASNGEFKLKGILKNSTKYRSYSESLNDADNNMIPEFQADESVFEACPTADDITSSNENNSTVTSPDSCSSSSLSTTPGSSANVKRVTFNNQVSRKTFKPGGPVSGMRKLSANQQRKLKKRKRQDSLNSQTSDQDDSTSDKTETKQTDDYKNPVEFSDVVSWQAGGSSEDNTKSTTTTTKSAVRFTNPLIFELDN